MKKLKLYGEKDSFAGYIGKIYVKDKKIIIDSSDEKFKQDLLKELNKLLKKDSFYISKDKMYIENEERTHVSCAIKQSLSDEFFLEAIRENVFLSEKYGGYKISWLLSKIINE